MKNMNKIKILFVLLLTLFMQELNANDVASARDKLRTKVQNLFTAIANYSREDIRENLIKARKEGHIDLLLLVLKDSWGEAVQQEVAEIISEIKTKQVAMSLLKEYDDLNPKVMGGTEMQFFREKTIRKFHQALETVTETKVDPNLPKEKQIEIFRARIETMPQGEISNELNADDVASVRNNIRARVQYLLVSIERGVREDIRENLIEARKEGNIELILIALNQPLSMVKQEAAEVLSEIKTKKVATILLEKYGILLKYAHEVGGMEPKELRYRTIQKFHQALETVTETKVDPNLPKEKQIEIFRAHIEAMPQEGEKR